jgi:hypothetical protein
MNPQRLRSYIQLIQKLLACPSGEEWILLRQNESLVTPDLVQVMEQAAIQLANQGNAKEAKFLHNLAGQIHHLFVAQTVPRSDTQDQSQAYLELIQALLNCPEGSEEELLAVNQELIGPGLVQMMQQVAAQMAASGNQETARYLQLWANKLNRLWLEQHDFQPVSKPDAVPNHFEDASVTPTTSPSPVQPVQPAQSTQPRASVPQPSPASFPEEEEDFWAEPSEASIPTKSHAPPIPETPIVTETPANTAPIPVQDKTPTPLSNSASNESLTRHLEAIATALTQLSETLSRPESPPPNPLWYMEVLERAEAERWVLTSAEIHQLIGVQPTCSKGSDSFQRGCWVFVKAGKVGTQTGWRVMKEQINS